MMGRVSRCAALSPSVTWWPSVLWQTTTLELRRDGRRLLVDPGIAPWEVREAAGDGADAVVLTHGDWDHVMGIGLLPAARVYGSAATAARIASGEARTSIEREAREYYIPLEGLEHLRVDETLSPGSVTIGPWRADVHPAAGHTADGVALWFGDEGVLVVGDYLSSLEIPALYDAATAYRETLERLLALLERERPDRVVSGHGPPADATTASRIAVEDLSYVEGLVRHAEAGRDPNDAAAVPFPSRGGGGDAAVHRANLLLACAAAG
jgi:glyoxylase-like metal-dependent hydrolase (beta-lactamase superfamily II)